MEGNRIRSSSTQTYFRPRKTSNLDIPVPKGFIPGVNRGDVKTAANNLKEASWRFRTICYRGVYVRLRDNFGRTKTGKGFLNAGILAMSMPTPTHVIEEDGPSVVTVKEKESDDDHKTKTLPVRPTAKWLPVRRRRFSYPLSYEADGYGLSFGSNIFRPPAQLPSIMLRPSMSLNGDSRTDSVFSTSSVFYDVPKMDEYENSLDIGRLQRAVSLPDFRWPEDDTAGNIGRLRGQTALVESSVRIQIAPDEAGIRSPTSYKTLMSPVGRQRFLFHKYESRSGSSRDEAVNGSLLWKDKAENEQHKDDSNVTESDSPKAKTKKTKVRRISDLTARFTRMVGNKRQQSAPIELISGVTPHVSNKGNTLPRTDITSQEPVARKTSLAKLLFRKRTSGLDSEAVLPRSSQVVSSHNNKASTTGTTTKIETETAVEYVDKQKCNTFPMARKMKPELSRSVDALRDDDSEVSGLDSTDDEEMNRSGMSASDNTSDTDSNYGLRKADSSKENTPTENPDRKCKKPSRTPSVWSGRIYFRNTAMNNGPHDRTPSQIIAQSRLLRYSSPDVSKLILSDKKQPNGKCRSEEPEFFYDLV